MGTGTTVQGNVYGNASDPGCTPSNGNSSNNALTIVSPPDPKNKITVTGNAYGTSTGNTAINDTSTANSAFLFNSQVTGKNVDEGNVYGRHASCSTSDACASSTSVDSVFLFNSSVTQSVYGGYATSTVSGGMYAYPSSLSFGNSTFLFNSSVTQNVYGAYAYAYATTSGWALGGGVSNATSTATANSAFIFNSQVTGKIYGGYASSTAASGPSNSAAGSTAIATDNTIEINGRYNVLDQAILYGGDFSSSSTGEISTVTTGAFSGNTLNLKSSGIKVAGLYNFERLNFTLPGDIEANQTLLTVTGANSLNYNLYDFDGSDAELDPDKTTLDILTPGSHFLKKDQDGKAIPLNGNYVLLSYAGGQTGNAALGTYSIHGTALTLNDGSAKTLDSGRVRGNFKISLSGGSNNNEDLMLNIGNYDAPNAAALTWKGEANGSGTWANYSATSPEHWEGEVTFSGGGSPTTVKQYLDGDAVTFGNATSPGTSTITLARNGVTPASVVFNNDEGYDYLLITDTPIKGVGTIIPGATDRTGPIIDYTGGAIMGETGLVKTGEGKLTLTVANLYTGGTTIEGGLINFNRAENFGIFKVVNESAARED
jgi:autotransporter-associated beta strand protein